MRLIKFKVSLCVILALTLTGYFYLNTVTEGKKKIKFLLVGDSRQLTVHLLTNRCCNRDNIEKTLLDLLYIIEQ